MSLGTRSDAYPTNRSHSGNAHGRILERRSVDTMTDQAGDLATRMVVVDGVATVTLARPESRNALSTALVDSLGDHLAAARSDNAVRVIVLTNHGTVFCAGADLSGNNSPAPRYSLVDIFDLILGSPKPVIGRIAGHCMGGGVGLAAACDISVIADDAKVGFTEVRIGVAPAMISVICLPKMRRGDALELFLSSERISATRAVEVGLINRVAAADRLDDTVAHVVDNVLAGGPLALAAAKRLVYDVPGRDLADGFAMTERLSVDLFASDEATEGIAAFREKRPPRWMRTGPEA